MMKPRLKFALLSNVLPPSWSGQAVILSRLLTGLAPESYCCISRQDYSNTSDQSQANFKLPGRYYHLPSEFRFTRGSRFGLVHILHQLSNFISLALRTFRLVKIIRQEKCTALIACTGDLLNLPAGYYASKLTGVSYYPYFFDDYSYQWIDPVGRTFSRKLEPYLARGASRIIVPNEFMQAGIQQRYNLEAVVIHNPCDLADIEHENNVPWPATTEEFKIVYTGAVYHANHDAFRNLIIAINKSNDPTLKLHLYTAQTLEELSQAGICGPVICHDHVPYHQIKEIQRQADILFLPLAFQSPIPEVIKTSLPAKMGEYLASGRPILAHAPADSFVSWYLKTHECALVVDRSDPDELLKAMNVLCQDAGRRTQIVSNASKRARIDFDPKIAQTTLLHCLHHNQ